MKRLLLLSILIVGSTVSVVTDASLRASATSANQWSAPRTVIAVGSTTPFGTIKVLDYNYKLNNQGHVAVPATVDNGVQPRDMILLIAGSSVTKLVGVGDPLPGGHTLQLLDESLALNDYDEIAFNGYDENTQMAIYLHRSTGLTEIVRAGDSTPFGGTYSAPSVRDLNNSTQITFTSTVLNGTYPTGLYLWSGAVTPVVGDGQPRPLGGAFDRISSAAYATSSGSVIFGMDGCRSRAEIDQWSGASSFIRLTGYGDSTSDGGTVSGAGVGSVLACVLYDGRSSASDRQVFSVLYNKNSVGMSGVFTLDNGVLNKVIADGDALPDGTIFQRQIAEQIFYDPYINSSGDTVFLGPARYDGTGRRLYVRKDGSYSTLDLASASRPYINDKDQVLYGVGSELRWVELATPDHSLIAFTAADASPPGLYTERPDGSDRALLVAGDIHDPRWSPDGTKIAYLDDGEGLLKVVTVSDGTVHPMTCATPASGFFYGPEHSALHEWSFDSKKLAYSTCQGDLVVADVSTGAITKIGTAGANERFPGWDPTADRLAFACGTTGENLCLSDSAGARTETISFSPYPIQAPPRFSPDGRRIVVPLWPFVGFLKLAVVNADGTDLHYVTDANADFSTGLGSVPAWSADGRHIAFTANPGMTTRVLDVDSGAPPTAPSYVVLSGYVGQQPWSPDGTRLVTMRVNTPSYIGDDLYIANSDGSGETPIALTSETERAAAWGRTAATPPPPTLDLTRSSVSVSPKSVSIGCPGSAAVTVTLVGADGNPYTQPATVQMTSSRGSVDSITGSPTNTSTGNATFTICSTTPGTATLSASADGSLIVSTASLSFTRNRYVALGDSVPYGHGLANPTTQRQSGLRPDQGPSSKAYPSLVARMLGLTMEVRKDGCGLSGDNLAVSGATSSRFTTVDRDVDCGIGTNPLPPHKAVDPEELAAANLRLDPPRLITIQVGANDVNFVLCMRKVIKDPRVALLPSCVRKDPKGQLVLSDEAQQHLQDLSDSLVLIAAQIRVQAPNARIALINYYQIAPPANAVRRDGSQFCSYLAVKTADDRAQVRDEAAFLQTKLNETISSAAAKVLIPVVDISHALDGHEMCTKQSEVFTDDWRVAHPTTGGQTRIANIIATSVRPIISQ